MAKLNFDDALEALANDRQLARKDVTAAALRRVVWIAEWHLPGCLSESSDICTTKEDAIISACNMAETEDGTPHGMKTALRKFGRFDCHTELYGDVITTVTRQTLACIL